MSNSKLPKARTGVEPDSAAALSKLMKDAPATREQHTERQIKRGEARRRIEDHLLEKAGQDLW